MWKSNQVMMEKQIDNLTEQDSDDLNSLDADLKSTDTNTGVDVDTVY